MFADEARFGRMNRPRPCWAPRPVRPGVASQLIREYIHLYGAVCPQDGACVYLIMPTSQTQVRYHDLPMHVMRISRIIRQRVAVFDTALP
jgi:hypothetical protein